jgi:hypothetical protein
VNVIPARLKRGLSVSNITGLKYSNQDAVLFSSAPKTPITVDLKDNFIGTWEGYEAGGPVIDNETLFALVQNAIQQVNPGAVLNSLNWGSQANITYAAEFVPPPLDAAFIGAGGTINITLFVPGNSLALTADGATFDVGFDLIINFQMTLPSSLVEIFSPATPSWSIGLSATADVEAFNVTTHNVGVFLCDQNAVVRVLNAINGKTVTVANITSAGLTLLSGIIAGAGAEGYTQLLQADDGEGNVDLTAVSPSLIINGTDNDDIQINTVATVAGDELSVSAHGQSITLLPGSPIDAVTVNLAGGSNSLSIAGLPPGVTLNVVTLQGGTTAMVIGGGNGLVALTNTVINVNATAGVIALTVDDSGDTSGRIASISNKAVAITGLTTINYTGSISSLKVQGGAGNDQFFVDGTNASTPTTVDAGSGSNLVYVGLFSTNPATAGTGQGSLSQLAGPLDITDTIGDTSLAIDASDQSYDYFQIYSDHVTFSGGPTINFAPAIRYYMPSGKGLVRVVLLGVDHLTIYGSSKGNNIQAASVGPQTPVIVWGAASDIQAGAALGAITHKIYPPTQGSQPPTRPIGHPIAE